MSGPISSNIVSGGADLGALTGMIKATAGVPAAAEPGIDYIDPITPSPADGTYSGTIITALNGEATSAMAFGDVCYCANGGTETVPTFKLAKGDAIASGAVPVVAMCVSTIAAGSTGAFLLCGFASKSTWAELTVGGVLGTIWLSVTGTTGNTWTQTEPVASGNLIQNLGFAVNDAYSAAHTGKSKTMLFNPIPTLVTV